MHTAERRLRWTWRKITATTSIACGLERTSPVFWNTELLAMTRSVGTLLTNDQPPRYVKVRATKCSVVWSLCCQQSKVWIYSRQRNCVPTKVLLKERRNYNANLSEVSKVFFPHPLWFMHLIAFMYQGEWSYVHSKSHNFCSGTKGLLITGITTVISAQFL